MKSLGPTVLCVLATGCSTWPDRAELASDVHATQGLRVRVRDVDGRVPGIDPEELRILGICEREDLHRLVAHGEGRVRAKRLIIDIEEPPRGVDLE